jgi:putative ABC transport system ATP-binding protein
MSEHIISARDLRKVYRAGDVEVHALRGVNLDVDRGEFLSIVGHSGSGKSTLFNIIGGLTPPTSGTIHVDGRDLRQMSESDRTNLRKSAIGFVFQKYNLLPTLTARDNIEIARSIAGRNGEHSGEFQEALQLLGIASRRAIVNHPAILLADEPTGNLDTENSENVLRLMRDLNEKLGQTIVMITHNPEAAAYGHRLVRMKDGVIVT